MRRIEYSGQFRRDLKRVKKRGKDVEKLKHLMTLLINGEGLPKECLDHPLIGNWKHCRDLHIEPDWLLIYRLSGNLLRFERTGSHSDLF